MKTTKIYMAGLLFLCLHGSLLAQVMNKRVLTVEGAKKVVAAAIAEAKKNNVGGSFAVVDDGGNLLYLERLDGTFSAASNISIGKARTAAIFKIPTSRFETIIRDGRTPMVALTDFTPLMGGVPITIDEEVVGAIGVSGAASAQQDEEFALAAAEAAKYFSVGTNGATSDVIYLKNERYRKRFRRVHR